MNLFLLSFWYSLRIVCNNWAHFQGNIEYLPIIFDPFDIEPIISSREGNCVK